MKHLVQFKRVSILLTFFLVFSFCGVALARTIEPIVSTEWLENNATMNKLVILDVRPGAMYAAQHIPESISEPFTEPNAPPLSAWITMRDDLLLEVPESEALFESIGNLGIERDSKVVIVTGPNPGEPAFYGFSAATRVADTLIYAGVRNVAILDGGFPKWVDENRATTTVVPSVTAVLFKGKVKTRMFVSMEHVQKNLHHATLIDARDADVYFGATIEPFAPKAGHIFSATSLPAPWLWDDNGDGILTYKDADMLQRMVSQITRQKGHYKGKRCHHREEIIVYCGVGGYASAWWYVFTQVLGYHNVKFYDGSAQEWAIHNNMTPYIWQ